MKHRALLLGVLAAIVLGLMIWTARYAGAPGVGWIFPNSSLTSQLFDLMLVLTLAFALVIGLARLARGRGADDSPVLNFLSWGGPLFGLLAGAREGSIIWVTMQMVHVTHFRVVAPTVVEALAMPLLGLLAGAVAAAFASPRAKA
jgi:hypothetical protein